MTCRCASSAESPSVATIGLSAPSRIETIAASTPGIAPPASSVRASTSSRSIDAPSSPRKRLRRPSSCARSSASESSRTMPSMRVFISETSASICCCPPLPRLRERTSTTSSTSASTAAAAPTATSAVVAVTASAIISLFENLRPARKPQIAEPTHCNRVLGSQAMDCKTIKPLVRIRTKRPHRCRRILAAKRILPFDAGGCASLPCSSGWQGPDPRPAFVVSAPI